MHSVSLDIRSLNALARFRSGFFAALVIHLVGCGTIPRTGSHNAVLPAAIPLNDNRATASPAPGNFSVPNRLNRVDRSTIGAPLSSSWRRFGFEPEVVFTDTSREVIQEQLASRPVFRGQGDVTTSLSEPDSTAGLLHNEDWADLGVAPLHCGSNEAGCPPGDASPCWTIGSGGYGGFTPPSQRDGGGACCDLREQPWGPQYLSGLFTRVLNDQRHFYDFDTLVPLVVGLGAGAVFADTQLDREIGERFQRNLRNNATDSVARVVKQFGDGYIVAPLYGAAIVSSLMPYEWEAIEPFEEWGERSFRAVLVGAIPMLVLQKVTGADRPEMSEHGSRWIPWKSNHGVSGHSFMGAIPFLTAAQMTENRGAKIALVFASTLPAWSRVNDNDHYLSQAVLGWLLGYLAVTAVSDTNTESGSWRVVPIPPEHGEGIGLEARW